MNQFFRYLLIAVFFTFCSTANAQKDELTQKEIDCVALSSTFMKNLLASSYSLREITSDSKVHRLHIDMMLITLKAQPVRECPIEYRTRFRKLERSLKNLARFMERNGESEGILLNFFEGALRGAYGDILGKRNEILSEKNKVKSELGYAVEDYMDLIGSESYKEITDRDTAKYKLIQLLRHSLLFFYQKKYNVKSMDQVRKLYDKHGLKSLDSSAFLTDYAPINKDGKGEFAYIYSKSDGKNDLSTMRLLLVGKTKKVFNQKVIDFLNKSFINTTWINTKKGASVAMYWDADVDIDNIQNYGKQLEYLDLIYKFGVAIQIRQDKSK